MRTGVRGEENRKVGTLNLVRLWVQEARWLAPKQQHTYKEGVKASISWSRAGDQGQTLPPQQWTC